MQSSRDFSHSHYDTTQYCAMNFTRCHKFFKHIRTLFDTRLEAEQHDVI